MNALDPDEQDRLEQEAIRQLNRLLARRRWRRATDSERAEVGRMLAKARKIKRGKP
jgi:hypothetical protein